MKRALNFSQVEESPLFRGVDVGLIRDILCPQKGKAVETPLLILSRAEIRRNYEALKSALPRVSLFYAVKSNNHPEILSELNSCHSNFDVCSAGELKSVLDMGVSTDRILHTHPIKSTYEFDTAVSAGVETFVVDNIFEVSKFSRYQDQKLNVLIRFRIGTDKTAVVDLQSKFGCTVEEVLPIAKAIKQSGHNFHGICFNIGSQCLWPENYLKAIDAAKKLISTLKKEGFVTRVLDIGGGFPVSYADALPGIEEFCAPICAALDKKIPSEIQILCEPGRFISATSVTLVTRVVGKAIRDGKVWYYLDDGLYSTFSGILYDHCNYPVVTSGGGKQRLSVLSGPTCDSFDVMYKDVLIPEQEVGDVFIFPMTGAYCAVSASDFNSLKTPEHKIIE